MQHCIIASCTAVHFHLPIYYINIMYRIFQKILTGDNRVYTYTIKRYFSGPDFSCFNVAARSASHPPESFIYNYYFHFPIPYHCNHFLIIIIINFFFGCHVNGKLNIIILIIIKKKCFE